MLDEYCTGKIPKSKKSKKMCFEEKNRVLVKHLMEVLKIKTINIVQQLIATCTQRTTHQHVGNCLKLFYVAT
jgi:hypothetical protein